MRAKDRITVASLSEERLTVPSLGGDGVVLIRSITFGQKIHASLAPVERQPCMLLAYSVRDEDGVALMSADEWDRYGLDFEGDFVTLLEAARRVSHMDVTDAKKD